MIQAHDSVIVRTLGRIVIPIAQLFGVYVLVFGNYGPGGGFVGCGSLAASRSLVGLTFTKENNLFKGVLAPLRPPSHPAI